MQYTKFSNFSVNREVSGQRIDNFLFSRFENIPKSRIYRSIRCGEFLVNGLKTKAEYRINHMDVIRIPSFANYSEKRIVKKINKRILDDIESNIIYEDKGILVLNKKTGYSVCKSSSSEGVIGAVRQIRKQAWAPHLIHRLDQGTSGCLLIAKSRAVLLSWQKLFLEGKIDKEYLFLTEGTWKLGEITVENRLEVISHSGRKYTKISPKGKYSITTFTLKKQFKNCALVSAKPVTGRTHQIRVHAKHIGYPIIGDIRYQPKVSKQEQSCGAFPRMFLHCAKVDRFFSNLSEDFSTFLKKLKK